MMVNPLDFIMVPEAGLEPACPCERRILSPLRLPISPLRHGGGWPDCIENR